jgi:hypothetical protein
MIVILVVHGELAHIFSGEVATAMGTHRRKQRQRAGSEAVIATLTIAASRGDQLV